MTHALRYATARALSPWNVQSELSTKKQDFRLQRFSRTKDQADSADQVRHNSNDDGQRTQHAVIMPHSLPVTGSRLRISFLRSTDLANVRRGS
jgi:hypothetical protein